MFFYSFDLSTQIYAYFTYLNCLFVTDISTWRCCLGVVYFFSKSQPRVGYTSVAYTSVAYTSVAYTSVAYTSVAYTSVAYNTKSV